MDRLCPCGEELFIFRDGTYCQRCGHETREVRRDARKREPHRTPIISLRDRLKAKQQTKKEKIKPLHDRDSYLPRRGVRR
jgi:uncharacterized Zn finger protein (UPF0148 family)